MDRKPSMAAAIVVFTYLAAAGCPANAAEPLDLTPKISAALAAVNHRLAQWVEHPSLTDVHPVRTRSTAAPPATTSKDHGAPATESAGAERAVIAAFPLILPLRIAACGFGLCL